MIETPSGWTILGGNVGTLSKKFYKEYDDGIYVTLDIRLADQGPLYQLWSLAEHRASGPNETLLSESESPNELRLLAYKEMSSWDEHIAKPPKLSELGSRGTVRLT